MTTHGNGVEIRLPWRADLRFGGHVVQLGFMGFFLFSAAQSVRLSVAVGLVALGGLLLYSWIYTLVNGTTVLIGPRGIEVSHGPLPSFSSGGT